MVPETAASGVPAPGRTAGTRRRRHSVAGCAIALSVAFGGLAPVAAASSAATGSSDEAAEELDLELSFEVDAPEEVNVAGAEVAHVASAPVAGAATEESESTSDSTSDSTSGAKSGSESGSESGSVSGPKAATESGAPAHGAPSAPDADAHSAPSTGVASPKAPVSPRGLADVLATGLRFSGYLQAQYQRSELSEDELQQGGAVLNLDRFVVRRGRLRLDGDWTHSATRIELDVSTTRGPSVGMRRAEIAWVARSKDADAPPLLWVGAGLVDSPFGGELRLRQEELLFTERSTGSLAIFPGQTDTGVRLLAALGVFRLDLAVLGGTPVDDRGGGIEVDPTAAPDVMGRAGIEAAWNGRVELRGGVSMLTGTGFSPGREATKNGVAWRDANENSAIDSGELTALPGTAARPSKTFHRWAANADVSLGVHSVLGWSRLQLEATLSSNLDRGLFVADPVFAGRDLREFGWLAAFVQDFGKHFFAGFRADGYVPDLDAFDDRRGTRLAVDSTITTLSALAGWRFSPTTRAVVQYDFVRDSLARDDRGVPADLRNDLLVVRVQKSFP